MFFQLVVLVVEICYIWDCSRKAPRDATDIDTIVAGQGPVFLFVFARFVLQSIGRRGEEIQSRIFQGIVSQSHRFFKEF